MDQHPVPQPISSYEFRLIGSMTLKQFAKLAGCALAALILYATPLPGFLKWPLIILFALLGLGMAFLPINERPLDVWIVAFFKAVFSPTQFLWQKRSPVISNQPLETNQGAPVISNQSTPPPVQTFNNYQSTINNINTQEQEFLKNLQNTYASGPIRPAKIISRPLEPKIPTVAPKIAQNDFIFAPTQPNIVFGVVKNSEGKFVESVIMEIRDSHKNVVRALRSNKLGQFRIATPLPNGTFEIAPEKEGLDFDIIKIDLKGEVVPPIEIISKPLRH